MRLLISWVRDFVAVTDPPAAIADKLALRGFEFAAVEPLEEGDGVIDFEVTANRPDCLSVVGFAREIATLYDLPLRTFAAEAAGAAPSAGQAATLALAPIAVGESDQLRVTIEDNELCPRYAAAVASTQDTTTPDWMRRRLQAAGVRPISPVVDITNYVLLEIGHPMHAFDLARLAGGELRIRRARAGERITTLDGVSRTLDSEMLVIADADRPQAVAGVMGGADAEVSGATRTVAFESAYFKPASVRRTSKRLGLKTEASARFERGADIGAPVVALQRAIALMQRIGAGRAIGPAIDRYPQPRAPQSIGLRKIRLASLLGLTVPDPEVERILRGLGLDARRTSDGWQVGIPTFRVDLTREVDLIEEVGRHFGYDRVAAAFPPLAAPAPPPDPRIPRDRLVRRVLTGAGLSEAVTFGIIEAPAAEAFAGVGAAAGVVGVANPLSAKFNALRPSLLPGLLDAAAHNRRHGQPGVALFEIGARFSPAEGETRGVAMARTGPVTPDHWSSPVRNADFFDLKGLVEQVCTALGASVELEAATVPYLAPGQSAVVRVRDQAVGIVGLVASGVAESRGVPRQDQVYVAELNLDRLPVASAADDVIAAPLPRHPSVTRDLSIIVADTLPAAIIRGTIQAAGGGDRVPLVSIAFFDRYTGKGIPGGTVSLSVRLTFQAPDRTLTDAEVQERFDSILAALVREHQAVQR